MEVLHLELFNKLRQELKKHITSCALHYLYGLLNQKYIRVPQMISSSSTFEHVFIYSSYKCMCICRSPMWVQCEECLKWRSVPADLYSVVPESWNCSENPNPQYRCVFSPALFTSITTVWCCCQRIFPGKITVKMLFHISSIWYYNFRNVYVGIRPFGPSKHMLYELIQLIIR